MRTLQPNTAVLVSDKNEDLFLLKALESIAPGFGEPPLFNAFGKEAYILTGYLNLPKIFEITLNGGIDPRTKKQIGLKTQVPNSFDELYSFFISQLKYFLDIKMKGNDIIEALYAKYLPVPFLSLWIDDCVENAKDYNAGGARYNTQYIQVVGLGTLTDCFSSIKFNVFDKKKFTLNEVLKALRLNFEGYETMRQIFLNKTPKYGNDDDYADEIAKKLVDTVVKIVESYPVSQKRECPFPKVSHRYRERIRRE